MNKEHILKTVEAVMKKSTDKSPAGMAYEEGFVDGVNYVFQKLEEPLTKISDEQSDIQRQ